MPHIDLGNVPSWLAAGSLLLVFVIFIRDRGNSDRSQVDRVGDAEEGKDFLSLSESLSGGIL
jgi:hypothetical protein